MFWAGGREASRVLCKLEVSAAHDRKGGVGWHRRGAQQAWDLVLEACLRIRAWGSGTVLTGARAGRRLLMTHTSSMLAICLDEYTQEQRVTEAGCLLLFLHQEERKVLRT